MKNHYEQYKYYIRSNVQYVLFDNFFFRFAIKKIFFPAPAGEIRKQYAAELSLTTRKSQTRSRRASPMLQDTRLVLEFLTRRNGQK